MWRAGSSGSAAAAARHTRATHGLGSRMPLAELCHCAVPEVSHFRIFIQQLAGKNRATPENLPNLLKGPKFSSVLAQKKAANSGLNTCISEGLTNNMNLTRMVEPQVLRRTWRERCGEKEKKKDQRMASEEWASLVTKQRVVGRCVCGGGVTV